jgi:hypothetical protein
MSDAQVPSVRVARAVIQAMDGLPSPWSAAVARTIRNIGKVRGQPIQLTVPDAPTGAKFLALAPEEDPSAPVVIYRPLSRREGQGPGWRVTALMDRDAYEEYKSAESQGLFKDPGTIRAVAEATDAVISSMGTISPGRDRNPSQRGPGAGH